MDTGVYDSAPVGCQCSNCGRKIRGRAVFTDGVVESQVRRIFYHPGCSVRVGNRLTQLGQANVNPEGRKYAEDYLKKAGM